MEKSIKRFVKVFPWYIGFSSDLLFYIAIDTLFLSLVKNFSPAQIVSLASLSQLACIVLQFPVLFVIKKIGNTASVRTGASLLFLSSILITAGQSYAIILLGRFLHDAAGMFRNASFVALENNLEKAGMRSEFVPLRTSGNTVYSVITMLISFVASYMFNLDPYFPMICCIIACGVGFILSLMMKDCSDYNKISDAAKPTKRVKIRYGGFIALVMIVYSLFYPIVTNGQNEGKLFIQQQLLLDFDVEKTALIIGAIVCISRIVRVCSNVVFAKLYQKYQAKMGVVLPVLLGSAIGCLLFGSLIPWVIGKILVMGLGYTIILFARDPFNLFIQDVVFENTPKEQHQTLLAALGLGVRIVGAGTGLIFSAILLDQPMIVVMAIMFAISALEVLLSLKLYRAIMRGKEGPIGECI